MDKLPSNNRISTKQTIVKRIAKKGGLRASINANCCDCIYDELEPGTWRKQVENCTVTNCELYAVRPKPKAAMPTTLNRN